MERLKQRVSIMTEIKGVSATELRSALQAMCEKDGASMASSISADRKSDPSTQLSGNKSRSTGRTPAIGDVLDHWYQELSAEELKHAGQKKTKRDETEERTYCSTPSLSPPRIIKTNDGIENWSIGDKDAPIDLNNGGDAESLMHGRNSIDLTQGILGTDPDESFNNWYDELLAETASNKSQQKPCLEAATPTRAVEKRNETKNTATPPSPTEDGSCDSIVGLKIKAEPPGEVTPSERKVIYSRRNHLQKIIEKRKQAGCLLSSDTALERLLKTRRLSPSDAIKKHSLNHQEFDCIWERASPAYTDNCDDNMIVPQIIQRLPPPPPPNGLKYVTKPFEEYIISSSMEDVIGEPTEEDSKCGTETFPPESRQKRNRRKPSSSRHVRISVHGREDIMVEDSSPPESVGCLGESLADMACGENLKDTVQACADKLTEAQKEVSSTLSGTPCSSENASDEERGFAPGLFGFVDQLAADLDKTISGLSEYIQSISTCGASSHEDAVEVALCGAPTYNMETPGTDRKASPSKTARRKKKTRRHRQKCCGLQLRRYAYV